MTQFTGSMVALITPFTERGEVDYNALGKIVEFQIDGGTDALIVCGTTGESVTMSSEEQKSVIAFVVEKNQGRVPVIAGTGSNDTKKAIEASLSAKEVGVDGLLVVTPMYNKPMQEGLVDYYTEITEAVELPVILYNVPGRTACNLLPSTVEKLASNPFIVAIKDATGDMNVATELKQRCGDQLVLLSGDDLTALPFLAVGGQGWISVTANLLPSKMKELYSSWQAGNAQRAQALHHELFPIHKAMFVQSNPIPCKAAMHLLGFGSNTLRSPLKGMTGQPLEELKALLKSKQVL